ncbi:YifB family Mg chelatase-like AAA ATPase [Rugosimonospora acidiphila]|uniref:YifB family Mg chelatase-like AAA ATPase n=1 Tax=Rugosimonospora acidiphila TaxID=556531 RepID=A0ABP9RN25_9ACTN
MSYAKVLAVALVGLAGHVVEIEADLAAGLPGLTLTGLPDAALSEARDRVRAALVNSGESWPNRRITVNLLPAAMPKHGSTFDLAVAVSILAAAGVLPLAPLQGVVLLGELGLDGAVRPVRGVLPSVLAAAREGVRRVVVPAGNVREAALVPGVTVRATDCLRRLVSFVRDGTALLDPPPAPAVEGDSDLDLADVVGQELGRRGLELAAAGGHHLSMIGPPGAGKTMLAQRLPSILPPLSDAAALEVTAVHSIAGVLPADSPMIRRPPFQAPHHTASVAALVGGGSGLARPGAISLSHMGILFLDEAPEFGAQALETLRQPLEDGYVVLSRSNGSARYPARIQLIMAANPCPCARPAGDEHCECSPTMRRRYLGRLSGPLMDRVDLQVPLMPVTAAQLIEETVQAEPSSVVAARVAQARAAAAVRWSDHGWSTNAEVPGPVLRRPPWRLPAAATAGLHRAVDAGSISARGFDRVLRVAWTIADLDGRSGPDHGDVQEALAMRIGRIG